MNKELDNLDQQLLNITQRDFPITSKPYQAIGEKLGIEGSEVIDRIKKLKEQGYIRRLGGIFSSKELGYVSTLVATKVEEDKFYKVAEKINQYPGVTHNYRRNHDFNLWFTLIVSSSAKLEAQLAEIADLEGVKVLRNLPAKNLYKLGVNLDMQSKEQDRGEENGS
ncbi:siroheme decarboxylase subunit alpha [Fuchsiella alkaliacetigena]|uniref:siroheme decarboxylase subunit alpha n=1 Tax=Fuchsiella alkaliacetigena TaxID=957042 RepID=UPI00200B61DF|nr:AsnC family transcriptional regulator [Fuchsiella alkaliacetigena]MCK8824450.1 AsnC family transcriptional regulator [Fuchsiella alkaliacetigena]